MKHSLKKRDLIKVTSKGSNDRLVPSEKCGPLSGIFFSELKNTHSRPRILNSRIFVSAHTGCDLRNRIKFARNRVCPSFELRNVKMKRERENRGEFFQPYKYVWKYIYKIFDLIIACTQVVRVDAEIRNVNINHVFKFVKSNKT